MSLSLIGTYYYIYVKGASRWTGVLRFKKMNFIYIHNLCVRTAMILASLRLSRRCVEMMSLLFDFDIYLICLFVIMCNYLVAYTHVYLVACGNMRALLHAYLVGLEALHLSPSTCTAFLYVRSDTTMDPMCVRAVNALVRLCICPGSSELSMFA